MALDTIRSGPILGFQDHQEQTEYIVGVMSHLEAITGRKLDEMQARSWLEKLKKYPKWKLSELVEYSGPMSHKVFEYLDAIQYSPPSIREETGYKQLEDHGKQTRNQEMAKDFFKYMRRLFADGLSKNQQAGIEREHMDAMKKKYTSYSWVCGMKENQAK